MRDFASRWNPRSSRLVHGSGSESPSPMNDLAANGPSEDPTLELLRRANGGDQAAWKALFEEHEPLMRSVLRRRIPQGFRPRFDTEDIIQSAWLALSKQGADLQLADARSFRAWLARVLLNKLSDRIRKIQRAADGGLVETRPSTEVVEGLPAIGPSLEELAQQAELMARMYERIFALERPDRDIVTARYFDELGWAEIAQRTGLAPATVRKRYNELLEGMVRGFF